MTITLTTDERIQLLRLLEADKYWGDEIVGEVEKAHNKRCDNLIKKIENK